MRTNGLKCVFSCSFNKWTILPFSWSSFHNDSLLLITEAPKQWRVLHQVLSGLQTFARAAACFLKTRLPISSLGQCYYILQFSISASFSLVGLSILKAKFWWDWPSHGSHNTLNFRYITTTSWWIGLSPHPQKYKPPERAGSLLDLVSPIAWRRFINTYWTNYRMKIILKCVNFFLFFILRNISATYL